MDFEAYQEEAEKLKSPSNISRPYILTVSATA
jgi:hypothetical protein